MPQSMTSRVYLLSLMLFDQAARRAAVRPVRRAAEVRRAVLVAVPVPTSRSPRTVRRRAAVRLAVARVRVVVEVRAVERPVERAVVRPVVRVALRAVVRRAVRTAVCPAVARRAVRRVVVLARRPAVVVRRVPRAVVRRVLPVLLVAMLISKKAGGANTRRLIDLAPRPRPTA